MHAALQVERAFTWRRDVVTHTAHAVVEHPEHNTMCGRDADFARDGVMAKVASIYRDEFLGRTCKACAKAAKRKLGLK